MAIPRVAEGRVMRTLHGLQIRRWTLATAAGALLAGTALAEENSTQPAQWTQKEFQFVYQGFTTHYSCDGLRDKVQSILMELGARKDSKVYELGCTSNLGRPDPFPGVRA